MRRIASMAQGYQICHCEERSDVAISQNPTGHNREVIGEIATAFPILHPKGTSSRFALEHTGPLGASQ